MNMQQEIGASNAASAYATHQWRAQAPPCPRLAPGYYLATAVAGQPATGAAGTAPGL